MIPVLRDFVVCLFVLVRTSREHLHTAVNDPIKSRNLMLQKRTATHTMGKNRAQEQARFAHRPKLG